ncbi:MAG: HupE/UreJ family protein, partial [Acidobacteriota bacterium]|nr:HupE/UreJ family protein [Acidobacteriota bacterium]
LKETLQFAGSHLLTSLLSFNVGVEIGQVLVLLALVPVLQTLFDYVVRERIGTIVLSALVAHVAWHWMADRWTALREFPVPALDAATLVTGVRVLLGLTMVGAVIWLAGRLRARTGGAAPVTGGE